MKKNILIVGASRGIGKTLYEALKAENNVITFSRTGVDSSVHDYKVDVIHEDLPDIDEPIDGLVYCPGSINLKPFRAYKTEDFKADFEINVIGAFNVVQKYLKNLRKSQLASVVFFSTVAVDRGMQFHASISSAKGAVQGMMRSLAAEFAPKIRFNVVAPSLVETPLAEKLLRNEKQKEASAERHPMKRIGRPDDIGHMVSFLLSDKSSWITGQVMHVDGGLSVI